MKNNKRNQIRILYDAFHRVGRKAFNHLDASGSYVFGEKYNVFHWLGAIPIFLLFMLLFTGLYMFIYYSMSIESTYESVKYITETAPGGLFIRSLHRYAADGVMFFLILHLFRVFFEEKYQNARWLAWVIGVFLLFLMLVEGVTGYMMAMDSKAQYVMEKTAEMLSGLKVFGDSLARSFAMQSLMSKWIMWVILVVHFAIPLLLLIFIYIHVKRVSRAKILPPRAVMIAVAGVFAGISLVFPVKMTPGADYSMIPHLTEMDWFYLFAKPFMEGGNWALNIWIAVLVVTVILYALPWLRKMPDIDVSEVDLDNCTGCGACALDCPYEAIRMVSRTDNSDKYKSHALTDPKLCMGCSVCVGSCNFEAMHLTRLRLPVIQDEIENALPMGKSGDKWVVIMCQRQSDSFDRSKMSLSEEIDSVVTLSYPCVGIVGPRLVEKVLDRGVRGVIIASCPEGDCDYREGNVWLTKRFLGQRRPQFKKLDETRPMAVFRYNPGEKHGLVSEIRDFISKSNSEAPVSEEKRIVRYLKKGFGVYHYSLTTIVLALLFWLFYLGALSPYRVVSQDMSYALLRIDFSYRTSLESIEGKIDPELYDEAYKRIMRFRKRGKLSDEEKATVEAMARKEARRKSSSGNRSLGIDVKLNDKLLAHHMKEPAGSYGKVYVMERIKIPTGKGKLSIFVYEYDNGKRVNPMKPMILNYDFAGGRVYFIDYSVQKKQLYHRKR